MLHEWNAEGGGIIRRWDVFGIILRADPPTGERDDAGQWVTVLTIEGCKVRFVGA